MFHSDDSYRKESNEKTPLPTSKVTVQTFYYVYHIGLYSENQLSQKFKNFTLN